MTVTVSFAPGIAEVLQLDLLGPKETYGITNLRIRRQRLEVTMTEDGARRMLSDCDDRHGCGSRNCWEPLWHANSARAAAIQLREALGMPPRLSYQ